MDRGEARSHRTTRHGYGDASTRCAGRRRRPSRWRQCRRRRCSHGFQHRCRRAVHERARRRLLHGRLTMPRAGRTWTIDGSTTAPSNARADMFELLDSDAVAGMYGWPATRDDEHNTGYRSPCVPGTPAALLMALERFGSLPRQRILEPAISWPPMAWILIGISPARPRSLPLDCARFRALRRSTFIPMERPIDRLWVASRRICSGSPISRAHFGLSLTAV